MKSAVVKSWPLRTALSRCKFSTQEPHGKTLLPEWTEDLKSQYNKNKKPSLDGVQL